jgi:hypothetical protein
MTRISRGAVTALSIALLSFAIPSANMKFVRAEQAANRKAAAWALLAGSPDEPPTVATPPAAKNDSPQTEDAQLERAANMMPLLNTEIVRKELELTAAQKEKIALLYKARQETWGKILKEQPDKERAKKMEDARAEIKNKLKSILEPRQIDRFLEILAQLEGALLIVNAEYGKNFDLTAEQQEKINAIAGEMGNAWAKLSMVTGSQKPISRDELIKQEKERYKKQQALIKEANEKIEKILTPKQLETLNKLKGKEVDLAKLIEEQFDAVILPNMIDQLKSP